MQYYNISLKEMQEFLKAEKGWREGFQNREIVFVYDLPSFPFLQIKVFTGISSETNQSRKCGGDAIRVACVNTRTNQGWIKAARVYRVQGWQANLKARVIQVIHDAKARAVNPQRNLI